MVSGEPKKASARVFLGGGPAVPSAGVDALSSDQRVLIGALAVAEAADCELAELKLENDVLRGELAKCMDQLKAAESLFAYSDRQLTALNEQCKGRCRGKG